MVAQVQKIAQSGHTVDNQIIVHFLKGQSTSEQKKKQKRFKRPQVVLSSVQCDQIGLFSKDLGDKFSYKSSPNIWKLFGPF